MADIKGIFGICLLFGGLHMTLGITVNIPEKAYKVARGEDVTIPCTFTPSPSIVFVSWTAAPDVQDDPEINIASIFLPEKVTIYKKYKGRATLDYDIAKGKVDLKLKAVTSLDTRSYECKVQVQEDDDGTLSDTAKLVVLVAPSTPICKVEGKAEYFQDISLTCLSSEGTPTPSYKWQSFDTTNRPRPNPPKATDQNGVLSLFNVSKETSGFYVCTSANEIRSATCNVTLAVMPPSFNLASTGIIAIAVVAGIALLLITGIIIYCRCCRNKEKFEEYAMGTPEGGEYTDKEPQEKQDGKAEFVNYEEENRVKSADRRDPQDDRSERSYDHRSDYDDRRDQYSDRRDDYDRRERYDRDHPNDDRRDRYDDRRDRYDDRRDRYDDRSDRYEDRRDRYDDRRDRYDDRNDRQDRYDDRRDRYDDRRDRHDDRNSDRYDDRPPSVPPSKPRN